MAENYNNIHFFIIMNFNDLYENKKRGSIDFPIELHYVDENHPRYHMPMHWHLEHELILVRQGSFVLSLNGKKFDLHPGDCVWIGEGIVHGGLPHDCIYECIVFGLADLLQASPVFQRRAADYPAGHTEILRRGSDAAGLAVQIFQTLQAQSRGYELVSIGLIWQLAGALLSAESHSSLLRTNREQVHRLKKVLTYIRNHFDTTVTLEELARVADMSPRYFCRAFSQFTGKTPIAYLNFYRIEVAGERLLMTEESITTIGFSCGFNDASYFSKMFLKEKGVSPSQYRKLNRS